METKAGPRRQKGGEDKWDGRSRIRLKNAKTNLGPVDYCHLKNIL